MTDLADVLGAVAGCVSYLRASTAVDRDDWVACDSIVHDRAVLERVIRRTRDGFGTDDDAVAASLFVQAYAFRVAGVALAAYALDAPVPDVAPSTTAVRLDKPRPSAIAFLSNRVAPATARSLAEELIDAHLGPFVASVHRAFRVGERLLWGNVPSSCATAFRAVESSGTRPVDRRLVRDRAVAFMAAVGDTFAGLGAFTTVTRGEREGWYWDRTNCCLWFRTQHGALCDNCILHPAEELHSRRIAELAESAP